MFAGSYGFRGYPSGIRKQGPVGDLGHTTRMESPRHSVSPLIPLFRMCAFIFLRKRCLKETVSWRTHPIHNLSNMFNRN